MAAFLSNRDLIRPAHIHTWLNRWVFALLCLTDVPLMSITFDWSRQIGKALPPTSAQSQRLFSFAKYESVLNLVPSGEMSRASGFENFSNRQISFLPTFNRQSRSLPSDAPRQTKMNDHEYSGYLLASRGESFNRVVYWTIDSAVTRKKIKNQIETQARHGRNHHRTLS